MSPEITPVSFSRRLQNNKPLLIPYWFIQTVCNSKQLLLPGRNYNCYVGRENNVSFKEISWKRPLGWRTSYVPKQLQSRPSKTDQLWTALWSQLASNWAVFPLQLLLLSFWWMARCPQSKEQEWRGGREILVLDRLLHRSSSLSPSRDIQNHLKRTPSSMYGLYVYLTGDDGKHRASLA